MPTILSRTVAAEAVGFGRASAPTAPHPMPSIDYAMGSATPNLSMMRCSLPPIIAAPDSVRQFYRGGAIPQSRLLPLPPMVQPR